MSLKLNEPATAEQHKAADKEFTQLASRQKNYLKALAKRIEAPDKQRDLLNQAKHAKTEQERETLLAEAESIVIEDPFQLPTDRKLIAAALRRMAELIPTKRPKPVGRPKKTIPEDELLVFQIGITKGKKTKEAMYQEIADRYEVEKETAEKTIKRLCKKKNEEGCQIPRAIFGVQKWGDKK